MSKDHPFLDDIPAYALGALDPENIAALDAHLLTCETCQAELAAYRAISANLLVALPPQIPPPGLRHRLQARLPSARKMPQPRFNWSWGRLAVGAAFVLLLALNLYSILQMQALQRQQTQLVNQIQTGQAALAMLAYPETKSLAISAQGVSGTVLVDESRNTVVLIVWDLPSLANNQTYQVWLTDPQGNRTSGGWFRPQNGQPFTTKSIFLEQDLSSFISLGVTVEPEGGSLRPTGPRIFKIDL